MNPRLSFQSFSHFLPSAPRKLAPPLPSRLNVSAKQAHPLDAQPPKQRQTIPTVLLVSSHPENQPISSLFLIHDLRSRTQQAKIPRPKNLASGAPLVEPPIGDTGDTGETRGAYTPGRSRSGGRFPRPPRVLSTRDDSSEGECSSLGVVEAGSLVGEVLSPRCGLPGSVA